MKKDRILYYVKKLATPVLVILLGLILLCNPDSASALIGKMVGWVLILRAITLGVSLILERSPDTFHNVTQGALAVLLAIFGGTLSDNPWWLMESLGLVLGILIACWGGRNLMEEVRAWGFRLAPGVVMDMATIGLGLILIFVPITASRIVFAVIGIVLMVIGVGILIDRLKGHPRLDGEDPNIIDVDKL